LTPQTKDIGIKGNRIVGIGKVGARQRVNSLGSQHFHRSFSKAGNPDIMDKVSDGMVVGVGSLEPHRGESKEAETELNVTV
jgi:urease alpha subunit